MYIIVLFIIIFALHGNCGAFPDEIKMILQCKCTLQNNRIAIAKRNLIQNGTNFVLFQRDWYVLLMGGIFP